MKAPEFVAEEASSTLNDPPKDYAAILSTKSYTGLKEILQTTVHIYRNNEISLECIRAMSTYEGGIADAVAIVGNRECLVQHRDTKEYGFLANDIPDKAWELV